MKTIFGIKGLALSEYAIAANAILGIRDSGKTYTATKATEELFDAGIPCIWLDPIGVAHNLRIPGKGRGYPVVVAGGKYGDLPLTVKSVGAIVRAAMKANISLVLDLFSVELTKADWRRIVKETCEILLHENSEHGLRHVFIEEAAEFVPQRVQDGQTFSAVEKLVRMGGNSKVGITFINQRSADLNKSVLELCANVFVHRQRGKNTLLDLKKWLSLTDPETEAKIAASLPDLPSGQCWVMSNDLKTPVLLKVPEKNSLHPDRRAVPISTMDLKKHQPVQADKFVDQMKAALAPKPKAVVTVTAKPETVAKLAALAGPTQAQMDRATAAAFQNGVEAHKGIVASALAAATPGIVAALKAAVEKELAGFLRSISSKKLAPPATPHQASTNAAGRPPASRAIERQPSATPRSAARATAAANGLKPSLQRCLDAIAWWRKIGKDPVERDRAAVVAGFSPKASTFGVYIAELVQSGHVDVSPGHVALTDSGLDLANTPDATTNEDIRVHARDLLKPQEQRIFDVIYEAWPSAISRDDIADAVNLSRTASTVGVYIAGVAKYGIVEPAGRGEVKAADWMFPENA